MRRNAVIMVIIATALLVACAPKIKEQEPVVFKVKVATPMKAREINEKQFSGIIEEKTELNLAFRVAGPIKKIYIKEGDFVKAGQLIAEIDTRDYEIQAGVAKAQYDQMKAEYDRLTELNNRKSVADNDYEKAVAGEKMLGIQLKHAQDQLNDTKLYAPFSGYIQTVKYTKGELINTGMTLATLIDVDSYSVAVDLPLSFYIQRENFVDYSCKQALVSDSIFPLELTGYQHKANNNQLYQMKFRLNPKLNKELTPGMNVQVYIRYRNNLENPLYVPIEAVFNHEGKTYVWIYNPKSSTVQRKEIVTDGLTEDGGIRIVSGLSETDSIVIAGVNYLHENEEVRLLEKASETNIGGLL